MRIAPGGHPEAAGGDAGELGHRYRGRVGGVGHRSGETGDQVADAVHRRRALNRPEVHRPGAPPGRALGRDGAADGADGPDQRHQQEGRKKRPERRPEVEGEAGPLAGRESDPRCSGNPFELINAEKRRSPPSRPRRRGPAPTAATPRSPSAPGRPIDHVPSPERSTERRPTGSRPAHLPSMSEDVRHHRHRDQHDHRPRDGGRQDPPEEREPRGQHEAGRTRPSGPGSRATAGPPSATAVMQTAMKAPELPIMSAWPMPMRPSRTVCRTVAAPQMTVAAKTAHDR